MATREAGTDDTMPSPAAADTLPTTAVSSADTAPPPPGGQTIGDTLPASSGTASDTDGGDYSALVTVTREYYAVRGEVARGGMGRISAARDRRLGRSVAIKELLVRDQGLVRRFEREARISARLQHPSIVSVYEAGRWPSGDAFFSMKLVKGRSLDKVVDEAQTLRERLALVANVIDVVDALAYAHGEGVIHRDLKPANVLVGDFGETVVIDWGLAKDLNVSGAEPTAGPYRTGGAEGETVSGSVMGTPAYMPPEQAAGDELDRRADVYALGALLYHVLAGAPPYVAGSADAILIAVLDGPPRPIAEVVPDAPPDLLAIVNKAMARAPAERFPSAREMADELKRFQTGQLVASHKYSVWELVKRWIARHRAAVAVGALALVVMAVAGTVAIRKIISARDRADAEAATARTQTIKAQRQADRAILAQAELELATDPSLSIASLAKLSDDPQPWREARRIAASALARGTAYEVDLGVSAFKLALAADASTLAIGADDRTIHVIDVATRNDRVLGRVASTVFALAVAPDGAVLVAEQAGIVRRCMTDCTQVLFTGPKLRRAVFAPDGTRLAVDHDAGAEIWDLRSSQKRSIKRPSGALAWSADGGAVLLGMVEGVQRYVERFDLATGTTTTVANGFDPMVMAADGNRVALGNGNQVVEVVDGVQKLVYDGPAYALAYASGRGLVFGGADGRLRDTTMGTTGDIDPGEHAVHVARDPPVRLLGHLGSITAVAWRGEVVASADSLRKLRVWRLPDVNRLSDRWSLLTADYVARPAAGDPVVARISEDGAVHPLACCDGVTRPSHADAIAPKVLVTSSDGRRIALLDADGVVTLWRAPDARGTRLATQITDLAIAADGATLMTMDTSRHLARWNVTNGAATPLPVLADDELIHIAFAPDLRTVAVATRTGVELIDDTGHRSLAAIESATPVFARDGTLFVFDATRLRRYDTATGGVTAELAIAARSVVAADADRVLVRRDDDIYLWTPHGAETLIGHHGHLALMDFDGDGAVSVGDDRLVRLWDLATRTSRALTGHGAGVTSASRVGGHVISLDKDGVVLVDADDLPRDPGALRRRLWP